MTDKQRLAKLERAQAELRKTTVGYTPAGVHWRVAMGLIDEVQQSLLPPPAPKVPNLGPITAGGKSLLLQDLTHETAGLDGYPAFDSGWVAGLAVIAPEALVVTRQSSAQGADAFFATGDSKIKYWIGHVVTAPANGTRFVKGATMGRIANLASSLGGPHVHLGVDAKPLIGHELLHHTNYTHGAPKIGVQLAKALV